MTGLFGLGVTNGKAGYCRLTKKMLLLDGQQRLTSLSGILNGQPVEARGRKKPVYILVNLEYELAQQRAANGEIEYESEGDDLDEDELDEDSDYDVDESDEAEAPRFLDLEKRLFVVYWPALAGKRNWGGSSVSVLVMNRTEGASPSF